MMKKNHKFLSISLFFIFIGLVFSSPVSAAFPVANFATNVSYGPAPLAVLFTDLSTGPTGWAWFFGDETFTNFWTQQNTSAGWPARGYSSCVALPNGSIVLMGGKNSTYYNDTWRSLDKGVTWARMNASSGWISRGYQSSVATPNGSIVLMGGYNGTIYLNDTWVTINNGTTWRQVNATSGWGLRASFSSVVLPDSSIVIMGGYNGTSYLNDTWRSANNGTTWTRQTASAAWTGREGLSSVVMPDGSIILMGGLGSGTFLNDVWRSADKGATWAQQTASAGWPARAYPGSVTMPDGSIVLMGGASGSTNYNDVWRSTNEGVTWTEVNASAGWSARNTSNVVVALPDASVVLAGGWAGTTYYNDTWRFAPAGSSTQNPSHTYTTAGIYNIALQAYNASGYNSTLKSGYITVTIPAPVASFSGTPTNGTIPLPVNFTDSSTNNPAGWAWFFGDENFTNPWTQVNASAGWPSRFMQTSVALPDSSIVLMGGYNSSGFLNDTWRSANNGATWTQQTASAGWLARDNQTSVALPDGSIVLMGGYNSSGNLNDTWRSTDKGATWTQVNASSGWSKRSSHSSVTLPDGSIVLMGGYNSSSTFLNDTWRSANNGATWTRQNASAGWSARRYHASVALPDGSIVLMGGSDSSNNKNDVWRSTDKGATWTQQTANAGWQPRINPSTLALPDGSIVLMGGYNSTTTTYYNDTWRSTDKGATWTQVNASAGWVARHGHSGVALPNGSVVIMGGQSSSGYRNDVWQFMPVGSSAQNPSHTYTTAGVYNVTLQVYNVGGYNSTLQSQYVNVTVPPAPRASFSGTPTNGTVPLPVSFTDSSTHSPTGWAWFFGDENFTNPWTQVNASAGWSSRFMQTSVTMPDSSIVLMGGYNSSGFLNDTWRSANNGATWTQQTASAGWLARDYQTSVALPDGSIVLMGGYNSSGNLNDTWRSTDKGATWTQVNASSGWSKRSSHSSVALPDGSIVLMGGYDSTYRNDTWRSANNGATWTQQNATSGWSARRYHSSVALPDGSIVLMGGFDITGVCKNDTWRSTDKGVTWTQQTANAGWQPRINPSTLALPDGSIVLMGGYNSNTTTYYNDTWRSTDKGATWTQVNASAGWVARYGHSGVALPNGSVVIMGGQSSSGYRNDVWQFMPVGSSAQNPSHTYTTAGVYNVTLQVYNAYGYNSTINNGYINVTAVPTITVSVNGYVPTWSLAVGPNVNATAITMNITSNANWAVSAVDNLDNGKPSGTAGQMAEWNGTNYTAGGQTLSQGLNITVGTNPYNPLTGTGTVILSGAPIAQTQYAVNISQVVYYGDRTLTGGHQYHIVITFTGSLT